MAQSSGRNNPESISHKLRLFASASSCLIIVLVSVLARSTQVADAALKVDGWTEVKRGWPLDKQNYFVATEKGHHFVQVKLPPKLDHDLSVSLNYYYHYARVRPVIQMTPCNDNIILNEDTQDRKGQWIKHTEQVSKVNCRARPELAFNVLLHDPGDVFAWTSMEIQAVLPPTPAPQPPPKQVEDQTETKPESSEEASKPESPQQPESKGDEEKQYSKDKKEVAELIDEDLGTNENKPQSQEQGESSPKTETGKKGEQTTGTERKSSQGEQKDEQKSPSGRQTESLKDLNRPEDNVVEVHRPIEKKETSPPSAKPLSTNNVGDTQPDKLLTTLAPMELPQNKYLDFPHDQSVKESKWFTQLTPAYELDNSASQLNRFKRADDSTTSVAKVANELQPVVCQPKQCDKHTFRMDRFSPLFNGAPKLPAGAELGKQKYFLNLKNQPLKFKIETNDEDDSFEDVDTCVELQLFMDKDTELELVLQDAADQQQAADRLLELIKRKAGDSGAGKWEKFYRCVSDYMPRYKAVRGASDDMKLKNVLKLALKPRAGPFKPDKLVSVLVDTKTAFSQRHLYPTLSYLPDAVHLADESKLANQWVLDGDGIRKPKVRFQTRPQEGAKSAGKQERVLYIDNIAAAQQHFDLTSRWLSVKDVELIDDPILMVYKLDKADWIKRIELQFQRSGDPYDKWFSQTAFVAQQEEQQANQTTKEPAASQLDLPVRMKGLDSETFRLRVRHHLKPLNQHSANDLEQYADKSLVVRSLAFADACSGPNNCRNGAACQPTGATTFECSCLPGYLGKYCQFVRPCEVIYGNLTGEEVCKSLGARCVEKIPVMRCVWPDDKYYQCKATFQQVDSDPAPHNGQDQLFNSTDEPETSEAGAKRNSNNNNGDGAANDQQPTAGEQANSATGSAALESLPPAEQAARLKGVVQQQAKQILIMGVFLAATLLFALVLIGNMIARVRKSNRRLARSQSDNVELARRMQPGTSGASAPPIFATRASGVRSGSRGAAVTAYNNSAFDVE